MASECLDRDMVLEQELGNVRKAVKAVRRSSQSKTTLATPHLYVRRIAAIVYFLPNSAELAAIWASRATRRRCPTKEHLDGRIVAPTVLRWVESLRDDAEVKAAFHALEHKLREEADDFLMETLVIEDLLVYWSRGIQTTTEVAIVALIRKWRLRPRSARKEL